MSLLQVTKERFLKHILGAVNVKEDDVERKINKILITDVESLNIMKKLASLEDLIQMGYATIQDITKKRQPMNLHGIYLIYPSLRNFQLISQDFPNGSGSLYKSCHVLTTLDIPDKVMSYIKSQRYLIQNLKDLREVSLGYVMEEPNLFVLGDSFSLSNLYKQPCDMEIIRNISERILSIINSTNELLAIRYFESSFFARDVAKELHSQMNRALSRNPRLGGPDSSQHYSSQILILDRAFDPRTPFLHELTLEAMAYDLLTTFNDGVFTYTTTSGGGGSTNRTNDCTKPIQLVLSHDDHVWADVRFRHIADLLRTFPAMLKQIANDNKMKLPTGKMSAAALRDFLTKYPAYSAQLKKYQGLYVMLETCFNTYESRNLSNLIKLEQSLATNIDNDGNQVPDDPYHILPILNDKYSSNEKFRAVALFALKHSRGMPVEILEKIISLANLNDMKFTLTKMERLGFPITETSKEHKITPVPVVIDSSVHEAYELSRFVPTIKSIIRQIHAQPTSAFAFPFVGQTASSSKLYDSNQNSDFKFGKWRSDKPSEPKSKPRMYIFILGGVTHSEIRTIHELQPSCDRYELILGGTQILTPDMFIAEVGNLS